MGICIAFNLVLLNTISLHVKVIIFCNFLPIYGKPVSLILFLLRELEKLRINNR